MNFVLKRRRTFILKSFVVAAVAGASFDPSSSEATTCLMGDIGKITCTSYDFAVPFNIIAPASPALTAIGTYQDTTTVVFARGISTGVKNEGIGTVTNAIALDVQPPINSGGGTITNAYGIYVGNPTVATNNYSIYSAGGKNYFAGNTDVAGTLRTNTICDLSGSNCKDVTAGWPSGGGSGSVTQVNTGAGLTGGPITSTGTISVDVGTTANKIVQLNSSGALPAISGANLTGISASKLAGVDTTFTSLTSGQVVSYNGSNLVNKTLATSDISGLTIALGNKLDAANMPASCSANQTLTFSSPTGSWNCSNIVITSSAFASQGQGLVLAGPASGSGAPSFRALQASDLPSGLSGSRWQENSGSIHRPTGNVGIGTTDPQAKLDVTGGIIVGSGPGARTINVATYFNSAQSTSSYVHIKTPFRPALDIHMYHFKVTGHAYFDNKDIDLTYVGYAWSGSPTAIIYPSSRDPQSSYAPTQYIGSDGHIYLRFKPGNIGYVTVAVDSIFVGNGRIVKPGEVTISTSTSATL